MDPAAWVAELGGNVALFAQAQGYHDAIHDRFTDRGGRIDVKSVVGTGVPTFGALDFTRKRDGTADVAVTWANGDGTVPGISATQGPIGPLPAAPAAQIQIQDTCGISHVPLVNDDDVMEAYEDWVEIGRVPRSLPGPCGVSGGVAVFSPGVLGARGMVRARSAAAGPPVGLRAAEEDSLIDVVDLPGRALVVLDDHRPITLAVPVTGETFTYAPISGAGEGTPLTYGPLTGQLRLSSPALPGKPPLVLLDGAPVAPHQTSSGQGPGGGGTPPSGGGAPPGGGGGPPGATPPSNRFKLIGRPRRRGRTIRMVVKLPGPGRLQVRATVKKGRRSLAAGRARKAVRKAGRVKLALRLTRAAPGKVSLKLTYTPAGGVARTLIARVRAPRR